MKFSQLLEDLGVPISTASFAGWSVNPNGNGFDLPREASERIKKIRSGEKIKGKSDTSILFGLNRRNYANVIGTTENYYNKEVNKIL
jgi:hypothetical protein